MFAIIIIKVLKVKARIAFAGGYVSLGPLGTAMFPLLSPKRGTGAV